MANKRGDYVLIFILFVILVVAIGFFLNAMQSTIKEINLNYECKDGVLAGKNVTEINEECLMKCNEAFSGRNVKGIKGQVECKKDRRGVVFESAVCLCKQSVWDFMSNPLLN